MAICAVLTGLVVLLGTVSGPVIIVLVLAGTPWIWRGLHRASRPASAVRYEPVLRMQEAIREEPGSHVVPTDLSTAERRLDQDDSAAALNPAEGRKALTRSSQRPTRSAVN